MPGRLGFLNFPFLSTLSLRRATLSGSSRATVLVFLSTLSLRRATRGANHATQRSYISIHALLAESDPWGPRPQPPRAISIHALLAESDLTRVVSSVGTIGISIHALLAESDLGNVVVGLRTWKFLSTLSLRRATGS